MKNRHKVNDVYNEKIRDNEEKVRNSNCIHSFDNVLNTYHNGTADMERNKKSSLCQEDKSQDAPV